MNEPHYDALVITTNITGSTDIIFLDYFKRMNLNPLGHVTLQVGLGVPPNRQVKMTRFSIVDAPSLNNVIIGVSRQEHSV
ncbi:hypothetical protein ACS0TY_021112 [Phlomoides rotata]